MLWHSISELYSPVARYVTFQWPRVSTCHVSSYIMFCVNAPPLRSSCLPCWPALQSHSQSAHITHTPLLTRTFFSRTRATLQLHPTLAQPSPLASRCSALVEPWKILSRARRINARLSALAARIALNRRLSAISPFISACVEHFLPPASRAPSRELTYKPPG